MDVGQHIHIIYKSYNQVDDRLGGAPANVACGLARLGTAVAFLGRLGEDSIGRTLWW